MNALLLVSALLAAEAPPTLRLPEGAKPVRYAVELTLDPSAEQFSGVIDIELQVTKPLSVLWLNARELTVKKSSADAVLPGGKDFIGLKFNKPLAAGAQRVHIEYT